MARTTKALSGPAKDKLLTGLVASTDGVSSDVARRIGVTLTRELSEVRVRRDTWDALRNGAVAPASPPVDRAAPHAKATAPLADRSKAPAAVIPAAPTQSATAAPPAAAFDPYAFSAVAVLTRNGKAALAAELAKIETASDLRALSTAQHLAIDPALDDVAAIRDALVAATERRIAERKAAAS